jgi:ABC-type transporter Mla MlaB component
MILAGQPMPAADPKLEIELVGSASGSHVRISGDIVAETRIALWGVESLLVNEPRVTFDFSAVTSIDATGLETVLSLLASVRLRGGESHHRLQAASGAGAEIGTVPRGGRS